MGCFSASSSTGRWGWGDIYRMMVESAEIWAVILTLVAVIAWPQLALWLPHVLGFN